VRLGYTLTEPGRGIDRAFAELAAAVAIEGRRVTGAVQHTERDAAGRLARMELLLLPERMPVDIAQTLGAGARGCRLDPGALEQATEEVARRVAEGADLLIVPRFGEREADGGGFRAAIAAALEAGVAVLVGVSPSWQDAFDAFAGGMAEQVAATPEALRAWAFAGRTDA
jgi:hypothetical protein